MTVLGSQRHLFDLPEGVAYLNCAYMAPLLRGAYEQGTRGLGRKIRPWGIRPRDFFSEMDAARHDFAALLGPPASADDIAIVPGVSYAMAVACRNIPVRPGQRVLGLMDEYPSTVLSWRARAVEVGAEYVEIPRPPDLDWTVAVASAIDANTAVAALPACHWTDGVLLDLPLLASRARQVGAALVLDLTQSLGAIPFDLAAIDPDFAVAACYKWLLGPYSLGFLYVAPRRQKGSPLEHHSFGRLGTEDMSAVLDYNGDFRPGARRFDMGESANFALLPVARAAIAQLIAWGVENVRETIGRLGDEIAERTASFGLSAAPRAIRAPHYLSLRSESGFAADLTERLATENVYVSVRGGNMLRITPHVYNEQSDVDRLFRALESVLGTRVRSRKQGRPVG